MDLATYHGDCLTVLRGFPKNRFDSIVTDPPYGLKFMGRKWDYKVPSVEIWQECLRVLKPGGYLLSFAGTRTQHRMAVNIEDAGFEIRDMIAWVYGSGFPKSLDVGKAIDKAAGAENIVGYIPDRWTGKGNTLNFATDRPQAQSKITEPATEAAKQWDGFGTALKPALEPITLARKPLVGTVAANVLKFGTGGLNIDGCRVPSGEDKLDGGRVSTKTEGWDRPWKHNENAIADCKARGKEAVAKAESLGRWPANLIHDGSEEVLAVFPQTKSPPTHQRHTDAPGKVFKGIRDKYAGETALNYGDSGSAARFFYCAKASKRDRGPDNKHPTVKPISLMRYLCRLITPPNGTILDPFMGSGSTGKTALLEGFGFYGIELERETFATGQYRVFESIGRRIRGDWQS